MSQVAKVFELQLQHQSFQWILLFSCSVMFNSLWPMDCSMPGYPVLHYLLEFAQAHVHWVGDVHSPGSTASNEHSGLISFRIDWFDLVAIRGTLKSLLYHLSSKATIFQCSAIFMVQILHLYMTAWKNKSLILQTFVTKVKWKKMKVTQLCLTRCNPIQSMAFSRLGYWNQYSFLSPGDLPNPGIKPKSPTMQADSLPADSSGKLKNTGVGSVSLPHQIFPTQESNWGILHCRWILYQLSYLAK